jgi:photosystem II stability/assembly factor-like uncharacterized protein
VEESLFLATENGVVVCQRERDNWVELRRGLAGRAVTSLIAREGVILAGTREGVFRSDDRGETWKAASAGLSALHVRWLAYHPDISDFELAGTEPAGIFVSRDGAGSWRECPEVAELRRKYGWSLPYSPEAGCVRGFAFHGQRAYAAVEDGCVLVSEDGGETWELAPGSRGEADHRPAQGRVHSDVHSIETHPASPDLVFAPTGGGMFRSTDGGKRWDSIYPRCYVRAVWVDPDDPYHLILGPADGVDYNGRIEVTFDGGIIWQPASQGLDVPWRRHMVERFTPAGGELLAVLSNGELIRARLDSLFWERILPAAGRVAAATRMEALV